MFAPDVDLAGLPASTPSRCGGVFILEHVRWWRPVVWLDGSAPRKRRDGGLVPAPEERSPRRWFIVEVFEHRR